MSSVILSTDGLDELGAAAANGHSALRRGMRRMLAGVLSRTFAPVLAGGGQGALPATRRWPFPPLGPARMPAGHPANAPAQHDAPDTAQPAAPAGDAVAAEMPVGAHVPGASVSGVAAMRKPGGATFAAALAADPALRSAWRRRQVIDVALVVGWGVMIPAMMWVGAAVGF
ncbi:hypothetical protein CEG14_08020 [Bordetella genomosp. 1]|uniref:Uncharacterized protein n=1 Tax=Bordetella genomosp. 1 TaxID=1395607 RepID=A0A261ST35_9BORD|nr:hypothetical protein [Bordetella genomosp. 1]OZI39453.1 hypothetical protein CEG14_08020 [Bordetella genomosp. 1]